MKRLVLVALNHVCFVISVESRLADAGRAQDGGITRIVVERDGLKG
jgi:hypothetical protein